MFLAVARSRSVGEAVAWVEDDPEEVDDAELVAGVRALAARADNGGDLDPASLALLGEFAVERGFANVALALLEAGRASALGVPSLRDTVERAVSLGHIRLVYVLLQALDVEESVQALLLEEAFVARTNAPALLALLLRMCPRAAANGAAQALLRRAATEGDAARVDALAASGAVDVQAESVLLGQAVELDKTDVAIVLMRRGAVPSAATLAEACRQRNVAAVGAIVMHPRFEGPDATRAGLAALRESVRRKTRPVLAALLRSRAIQLEAGDLASNALVQRVWASKQKAALLFAARAVTIGLGLTHLASQSSSWNLGDDAMKQGSGLGTRILALAFAKELSASAWPQRDFMPDVEQLLGALLCK